jgi:hypothetical protein
MARLRLTMFRGDTAQFQIAVTDVDGHPVNLTGCSLWFTAKIDPTSLDAAAQFQKKTPSTGIAITDAANGIAVITMLAADTSSLTGDQTLECDVQLKDGTGAIQTVARGQIKVLADITLSTT